jgi:cell division protein FtsI (penicillin-binding protein 3)
MSDAPHVHRLSDVIAAREHGIDPNAEAAVRRENIARRRKSEERRRASWRLKLIGFVFVMAYASVAGRMGLISISEPEEPKLASSSESFSAVRGDIVDRNGAILATNLPVWSLYARPQDMIDAEAAARGLAKIFPDLDPLRLLTDFTGKRKFLWIKRAISPAERVAVHDLGEPGLQFGPRETRIYPAGRMAAHILGGASFGKEGVRSAEIIGVAGVEHWFDEQLRDPAKAAKPLELSLDLTAQAAFTDVLGEAVKKFHAKGAAGVFLDARNGEIIALASMPDFDPNQRPDPPVRGMPEDSPLFNRAAQGVYELGSTFKAFTAAMVMEYGLATPDTMVDTKGPLAWGRFRIRDFHRMPPQMTLRDVIVESSNVGTARLAVIAGARRQQEFLESLGFFAAAPIELAEARKGKPLLPPRWSELSTMTISYGHGLAATPLHLAAAYASIVNGGLRVRPTLVKNAPMPTEADRVVSTETSIRMRNILRKVVTDGTGRNAEVKGYFIGGKTGTADKPKRNGRGYHRDKVIATFAAIFPAHDPRYVVVISLDEAEDRSGPRTWRTAGWTAAPTMRAVISRIAPILGMRPEKELAPGRRPEDALTLAGN